MPTTFVSTKARGESIERNRNFPFDPRSLDAVVLSHAHIDHCGNLPNLVDDGYEGPVYATRATVDLATIMMADSGRIQESDAEFVNKKRAARGEEPIEPLYTEADAVAAAAEQGQVLRSLELRGRGRRRGVGPDRLARVCEGARTAAASALRGDGGEGA